MSTQLLQDDELSFDVCIAGTGLSECLLAAGLSARGYQVLQIDRSGYYGGGWASLNLTSLESWINESSSSLPSQDQSLPMGSDEPIGKDEIEELTLDEFYRSFVLGRFPDEDVSKNIPPLFVDRRIWFDPFGHFKEDGVGSTEMETKLRHQSNRFNFDLSPKILYSDSPIISILITSGVSRYLDFRGVDGFTVLLPKDTESQTISEMFPLPLAFEVPPISKAAIFRNTTLSLVERRNLMKFTATLHKTSPSSDCRVPISGLSSFLSAASIYAIGSSDHQDDPSERTWASELERYQLSLGLRRRITYGVCLKNYLESSDYPSEISAEKSDWFEHSGLERLHLGASSFGKYSDGSFIMPTFGTGDLAQSFARLSAVYRGVYMLRTGISHFLFDRSTQIEENKSVKGVDPTLKLPTPPPLMTHLIGGRVLKALRLTNGQTVHVKRFVSSLDNITPNSSDSSTPALQNESVPNSQIVRLAAVVDAALLPGRDGFQFSCCVLPRAHPIQILQLNWNSGCCPIGHFVIYMTQIYPCPFKSDKTNQTAVKLDAPPQYSSLLELLNQMLASRPSTKCHMLSTWTQNVRILKSQTVIENQFYLMPDPLPEGCSVILSEVDSATETLRDLLDVEIDHLIPQPPHVEAEREKNLIDAANKPFNELEEITTTHH